jgi:hypothetical protein
MLHIFSSFENGDQEQEQGQEQGQERRATKSTSKSKNKIICHKASSTETTKAWNGVRMVSEWCQNGVRVL